jgi:hypothetical protein
MAIIITTITVITKDEDWTRRPGFGRVFFLGHVLATYWAQQFSTADDCGQAAFQIAR